MNGLIVIEVLGEESRRRRVVDVYGDEWWRCGWGLCVCEI